MNKNIITCKEGYTHELSCKHERGVMAQIRYRAKYDTEFEEGLVFSQKDIMDSFEAVERESEELDEYWKEECEEEGRLEGDVLAQKIDEIIRVVNTLIKKGDD